MCYYEGSVLPTYFESQGEKPVLQQKDRLYIISRDFLSALQRLLNLNYDNFLERTAEELTFSRSVQV